MKITATEAVALLKAGEVVAVPTETVYGLAAIASIPSAVAEIFNIKSRPADNPLICHFHSIDHVEEYVSKIPDATKMLMEYFSPGPLSFMLDLPENSPLKFATCGSDQVIVRIPNHPVFLFIIKETNEPVAAPSANTSGRVSPTSAEMVENDLGEKIKGIVDGGQSEVGLESAIVDARSGKDIFILRPGAIGEKEIKTVLPDSTIHAAISHEKNIPGSHYRHYAPQTPVEVIGNISALLNQHDAALILTQEALNMIPPEVIVDLMKNNIHLFPLGSLNNLNEIARNFYLLLSKVDQFNLLKAFFLNPDFGDSSLGKALHDRLKRIVS